MRLRDALRKMARCFTALFGVLIVKTKKRCLASRLSACRTLSAQRRTAAANPQFAKIKILKVIQPGSLKMARA